MHTCINVVRHTHIICQTQLVQTPQPLEGGRVNEVQVGGMQPYVAMQGVVEVLAVPSAAAAGMPADTWGRPQARQNAHHCAHLHAYTPYTESVYTSTCGYMHACVCMHACVHVCVCVCA